MPERIVFDHAARETPVVHSKQDEVRVPEFVGKERDAALSRLSEIVKTIATLEEEIIILNDAITTNGEKNKNSKRMTDAAVKALSQITDVFEKFSSTKGKPVTHEQILDLVPIQAGMIKELKRLKREEVELVAHLPADIRRTHRASAGTRSKLRTGKIHLPPWIAELVEPVSIEQARNVIGEDFFGPEAIKNTLFYEHFDIPPFPFTLADLKRAKEIGERLILRVDPKIYHPEGLTLEELAEDSTDIVHFF